MNRNALNSTFLAIALSLSVFPGAWAQSKNAPWDPSPVGSCSKDFDRELMKQRRENGELVVFREREKLQSAQKKYVWVWDGTPSRNPTRLLYEVRGKRGCVILFMPYADTTDFRMADDGSLPPTVSSETQPLPNPLGGYASTVITYDLDKKSGQYSKLPSSCERKTEAGKVKIDCAEAFE